jgi:hypothetical protein
VTAIGAGVFTVAGFAAGAFVSAWQAFQSYADPWRKMHVEHEGVAGVPSHTRVVIDNPKMGVQAIDLTTNADGSRGLARISLRDGEELTMTFDEKGRPAALMAPDGTVARFTIQSSGTRVAFYSGDGTELASKRLVVPVQLLARAAVVSKPLPRFAWIDEARADQSSDDDTITVTREIPVGLDVQVTGPDAAKAASAVLEVACAPLACVPSRRDLAVPGATDATIIVSGKVKRSALGAPGDADLSSFEAVARAERKAATKDLPAVARVVSYVGLTAMACKLAKLDSPLCVKEFRSDPGVAGGAISNIVAFVLPNDATTFTARAKELYIEDEARALLDKDTHISICVNRDGFAKACADVVGRPFGASPMQKVSRTFQENPMIGGTLLGSFVITQSDGSDCTFSPSPRTDGVLRLSFDDEHSTVSASMAADQRGSRANLTCSLGAANMNWNQNYSISASQTFTKEQLHAGGQLPLKLMGTMTGSGGYSFSNCRDGGGSSASCPGGKNDGYGYPVEIDGTIDLGTHIGSGQIIVRNAPLSTQGTWRVPAEPKP